MSDSKLPVTYKQDNAGIFDSVESTSALRLAFKRFYCREHTSANLFQVRRGLSFRAGADPWTQGRTATVDVQEKKNKVKEAETEAAKNHAARQLIKKLVNFRMKEGKRTRARAIAYQTFHRLAQSERNVLDLLVEAVENVKPVCEVEKVGVAGTIYDVPGIVDRDRQETLAIRWILDAASKRRGSHKVTLEKCLESEILDAHRKRGHARKKRDTLHKVASNNRSFAHFRWW